MMTTEGMEKLKTDLIGLLKNTAKTLRSIGEDQAARLSAAVLAAENVKDEDKLKECLDLGFIIKFDALSDHLMEAMGPDPNTHSFVAMILSVEASQLNKIARIIAAKSTIQALSDEGHTSNGRPGSG